MKKTLFFLTMLALSSSATSQQFVFGGSGTVCPVGASCFIGITTTKNCLSVTWYGGDCFSLDLSYKEAMFSFGGRVATKNRDRSVDFISLTINPPLLVNNDWTIMGMTGLNVLIESNNGSKKLSPIFGFTILKNL
ncbi:MAG TPA: hypothetical protein PLR18_00385 [bacterium]|nr:hypothetical protein [bacterium]